MYVLFMLYQISNLKRLEFYFCVLGRDMQGTEGSEHCANPQDTWLPSRICERCRPHPIDVGSSAACIQMRKICYSFPSPTTNLTRFSSTRAIFPQYEAKKFRSLPWIPSSWPYAYLLGVSLRLDTGERITMANAVVCMQLIFSRLKIIKIKSKHSFLQIEG